MSPPVLVVVGGSFLLGLFSWLSISGSFQIILPIMLLWLIPWHHSLYWIIHVMVHFWGALIVLVCWILALGKIIHQLCFVPLVLICRMHPNKYGESFHFFCIILLHLDVSRCNLEIKLPVSRFRFSAWFALPPVISVPSALWGLLIYHNIEIIQQFSGVFFIIVIQFSAGSFSDSIWLFFYRLVMYRVIVIPWVPLVFVLEWV